jgi:hypothetical protein
VTLARQYGFGKWQTIFDDGGNSALKSKRGHVNALLVGDSVFIPEKKPKTLSLGTDSKYKIVVAVPRGVWNLAWSVDKARCGDKVTLTGETNLPDGNLDLALKGRELESPKLPKVTVTVKAKKFSHDWTIKDVQHLKAGSPTTAFPEIHIDATTADSNVPCNVATLSVQAVSDADEQTFDKHQSWSGFSNHALFDQRIERFVNLVDVKLMVLKAWGGTHVDLTSAGITGTAGGCPWPGHRWARPKGLSMVPAEYHDGKTWVRCPRGSSRAPPTTRPLASTSPGPRSSELRAGPGPTPGPTMISTAPTTRTCGHSGPPRSTSNGPTASASTASAARPTSR